MGFHSKSRLGDIDKLRIIKTRLYPFHKSYMELDKLIKQLKKK